MNSEPTTGEEAIPPPSVTGTLHKTASIPVLKRSDIDILDQTTQHKPNDPEDAQEKLEKMRSRVPVDPESDAGIIPQSLSEKDQKEAMTFCDDSCLKRYLRARAWDVDKAAIKLRETLLWRAEYRPHELSSKDLIEESKGGNTYLNGQVVVLTSPIFDRQGRPIIYLRKRSKAVDPEKNIQLLVKILEDAISLMPAGVEKVCLILDMTEYTRANSPPLSATRLTLNILSNHYPERLGISYIVNAPWIFNTLWAIVSPFLDAVTRSKVRFATITKFTKDVPNALLEGIDAKILETEYGGNLEFKYEEEAYRKNLDEAIEARKTEVATSS
ncbi:hypothetical protein HDU97_005808 [Phlyctochytrium planicorne]|nr:hypothetical protein HDU97_005808 [Phlyctochytrium planicorne]